MKVSIIGAGSFGTTLAMLAAENSEQVSLWARNKELAEAINSCRENEKYLPGAKLPKKVLCTNSLRESVGGADIVVNAVPSQFTRKNAENYKKFISKSAIAVNVAKGIEIDTGKTMSQVLRDVLGKNVPIVALSGPNIAEEISKRKPTATVIASDNPASLQNVKDAFHTEYFKVLPHDDAIGIEVCGAIKNIAAIATGVCDGLGYGDNAKASIITLGLMEMSLVGQHLGAKRGTFYGIAGVGDLVATFTSKLSRNRFVGENLAKGKNIAQIQQEMHGMVAEGVMTTKAVYNLSKKMNISLPLTSEAYHVLYENKNLKDAISDLLNTFD